MKSSTLLVAACAGVQSALALRHTINPNIQNSVYGSDYRPLANIENAIRGPRSQDGKLLGVEGVKDLTSSDLLCGAGGNIEAKEWLLLQDNLYGLKINWETFWDKQNDRLTEFGRNFKGVYAAYVARPEQANDPDGWVKITHWGYQTSTWWRSDLEHPVWGSDVIKNFKGDLFVPLPSGVAPGKYLIRLELIDLSNADQTYNNNRRKGAVVYPICFQIEIAHYDVPEEWADLVYDVGRKTDTYYPRLGFPGTYNYGTSGIRFDVNNADPKSFRHPSGQTMMMSPKTALDFRASPIRNFDLSIFRTLPAKMRRGTMRKQTVVDTRAGVARFESN